MFSFTVNCFLVLISATVLCQGRSTIGKTGNYVKTNDCKDSRTCDYDYSASAVQSNGEEIDVYAKIGLFCESTGMLKKTPATRSCITVKSAVVVSKDDEGSKQEKRQVLPDKELSGWFCFVQSSSSGKILGVFYPKDENEDIVNFKKSIVSAFQANYKHTATANETDSLSRHTSHYNYTSAENGKKEIQQRTVNNSDIKEFAGKAKGPKKMLSFHENDKLEMDSKSKRVYSSKGESVIDLSNKDDPDTADNESLDTSKDVPTIGAKISYNIKMSFCHDQSDYVSSQSRSMYRVAMSSSEMVTDDLLAKKDTVKQDLADLKELNDDIPSLDETITRVQRDVEPETTQKMISNWRIILEMESTYGPLPGTQAKLPQLIERLQKVKEVNISSTSIERMFLYHLLSLEGSLNAQKALLEMLHYPLTEEERSDLLLEIALLSSAHVSTVDYLTTYLEQLDNGDDIDQLILSLATLGRHSNVEEKIANMLSKRLMTIQQYGNDTASVVHIIHALGNTGSKRMIPVLLPFLSEADPQLQLAAIDALRTVTMEKQVQKAFISVVKNAVYVEQVLEVVESLIFPFKHSLYFSDEPEDYSVESDLLDILLNSSAKFHSYDLNKALKIYASYINDQNLSEQVQRRLSVMARERRSSTTDWNSSSDYKYNLVASRYTRTRDEQNYPYHKAFLWATQVGTSKVHAKIAAGGFGGVGIAGFKAYARGRMDVFALRRTFTVLDIKYSYTRQFPNPRALTRLNAVRYIKLAGSTLVNYHRSTTTIMSYTRTWYRSLRLFRFKYSIFIYVGTLDLYVQGSLNGRVQFNAYIARNKAVASISVTPSVTITAGASVTILLKYRVGLDVSANLGYKIQPQTRATLCDTSPVGDATACFEILTQPQISIHLYAYWRKRKVKCKWFRCKISWSSKRKVRKLSKTWRLLSRSPTPLLRACSVCNCYGSSLLNKFCKRRSTYGRSTCSCRNRYLG